jgi:hypothetical protein
MDTSGQNMATLGQSQSFFDAYARTSDGNILEWRSETDSVLMARSHVPEAGMLGTRLTRTVAGYGVDRVDLRTLRATQVEERAAGPNLQRAQDPKLHREECKRRPRAIPAVSLAPSRKRAVTEP